MHEATRSYMRLLHWFTLGYMRLHRATQGYTRLHETDRVTLGTKGYIITRYYIGLHEATQPHVTFLNPI